MTQTFSKTRLIDYFALIDVEIEAISEKNDGLTFANFMDAEPIIPRCSHRLVNFFPKKLYKDCYDNTFETFNHIINNLINSLPNEELHTHKPENKFFSLLYTESGGQYYYGHYLRVYEEYKSDHPIYKLVPKEFKKKMYGPKYLCFMSWNPFFISFKSILEDIYSLSNENSNELIKVENYLNFLLYRVLLPKYEDTQISFTLKDKIYKFNSNSLYSELSLKLLFQLISVENIVKIVFAYLMNSWIIFLHSNIEVISPIISAILSLVLPFPPSYSIIINVKEKLVDVLECPVYPIIGIYRQGFPGIDPILKRKFMNHKNNKNAQSYIIFDLDNKEMHNFNTDINASQIKDFEDRLIRRLKEYTNVYDATVEVKKIDVWKEYHCHTIGKEMDKSEIMSNPLNKTKGNANNYGVKKFDEIKIRAQFLDFIAGLFEAFDENKHYKIENYNKVFVLESFINDSKENLKEFLKVFTSTPVNRLIIKLWDIFIQNISYIVNTKYQESMKSLMINQDILDLNKGNNKSPAILSRCDRVYELFVKAIEKKKTKKSLKSLFKINISHNISLPQIPSEYINYSQTGIFENPLNEIKFTHSAYVSLQNNQLNIPFATLQEHQFDKGILTFIPKESLSKFLIVTTKNLSEEYCKYYRKYYDQFIKFFGFSNRVDSTNILKSPQDEANHSKSVKLQKVMFSKDNYVNSVQKIIGVHNSQKMLDDFEIIATNKHYKNEFNINVGINVLQTVSLCEFCKEPNCLWEIRKNIRYEKKPEKRSKVVCKVCNKPFVAFFVAVDDPTEDEPLILNKVSNNLDIESFMTEKSILEIKNELRDKKDKDWSLTRRIEYMSMEHIYEAINALKIPINDIAEKDKDEEKGKNKKEKDNRAFPPLKHIKRYNPMLYHNLLLLFGDFKIISDNYGAKPESLNIEEYLLHLEAKNKSYVNKWKKPNLEKVRSKSKDKKLQKLSLLTKVSTLRKEPEKKKVFKCELRNFMTKQAHEKFQEDNLRKLAQLNSSMTRTDINSVGTDFPHTINKTNENISELFQSKRSEGYFSMNSINPMSLKRTNTKEKGIGTKIGADEEYRDLSHIPTFQPMNSFEFPSNKNSAVMNQKKMNDSESQFNTILGKKTSDFSKKEIKQVSQSSSNYKDIYNKKHNYPINYR